MFKILIIHFHPVKLDKETILWGNLCPSKLCATIHLHGPPLHPLSSLFSPTQDHSTRNNKPYTRMCICSSSKLYNIGTTTSTLLLTIARQLDEARQSKVHILWKRRGLELLPFDMSSQAGGGSKLSSWNFPLIFSHFSTHPIHYSWTIIIHSHSSAYQVPN